MDDEDFLNTIMAYDSNKKLKGHLHMKMIGFLMRTRNCTSFEAVSWALEHGIEINDITLTNYHFKDIEFMKNWFKRGLNIKDFTFNPFSLDYSITSSLGQLCKQSDINSIHALLTYTNTDVNNDICGVNDAKAVHIAARFGQKKTMIVLLKKYGADINARTDRGVTPLMLAVKWRHFGMVKYLVKNGAKVHDQDLFEHPVLSFIEQENGLREYNVDSIRSFLQEHA